MKTSSKIISKVLVLLLLCTLFMGSTNVTYAASSVYSLNTDDVYIPVKGGQTVYVRGLDSASSAVWTSENEKIATVKNGTISGVKIGETKVTAKIGKVKLTVNVHVMWPDQMELSKKFDFIKKVNFNSRIYTRNYWLRLTTDKAIYEIKNSHDYAITIKAQMAYIADGRSTGCSKVASVTIPANDIGILVIDMSDKPDYEWTHSETFLIKSVTKAKSKFYTSKIKITDKQLEKGDNPVAPIEIKVKNNSGKDDVTAEICVLYYSADDKFVGIEKFTKKLKKGTNTFKTKPSKYAFRADYESEFADYTYDIIYVAYK